MLKKDRSARDAFTLSLGGTRTINSFAMVPVIAHDQLHQELGGQGHVDKGQKWRLWMPRRRRVA